MFLSPRFLILITLNMSNTARRTILFASLAALVIFATVVGFSYLQSSTVLAGDNSTISSLKSQVSSESSVISSLQNALSSASGVTTTITVTSTSVSVSTYTPSMISVTRPLRIYVGNTTSNSTADEFTVVKIYYVSNGSWADSTYVGPKGIATTHVEFSSGTVLEMKVYTPFSNILIGDVQVVVPEMSSQDASILRAIPVTIYIG